MREMQIAKMMIHKWEEEPISGIGRGYDGTFAIFFYGCTMRCVYCQNSKISHRRDELNNCRGGYHPPACWGELNNCRGGYHPPACWGEHCEPVKINYTSEELSDEIIKHQSENIASISFITGALYVDQIAETIRLAKQKGLKLPVVYNSSGYETVAQIKKLEGLIDIYLPDFKYFDNELGKKYSGVPNYVDVAKSCIGEMDRQIAEAKNFCRGGLNNCSGEFNNCRGGYHPPVCRGEHCEPALIVRHLVLPANTENSKAVIKYLYDTYGDDICLSIMSQYTPMPNNENIEKFPELLRKVTKREYERVVNYAIELGVKNAFIQEGDVADESFIPEFR